MFLNQNLKDFTIILASESQRRLEILVKNLKIERLKIIVVKSNYNEILNKNDISSEEYALKIAQNKSKKILDQIKSTNQNNEEIFSIRKNVLIISGDTIVSCNDEILEKPLTTEKKKSFFSKYAEIKEIKVITGVSLIKLKNINMSNMTEKYYSAHDTSYLKFDQDFPVDVLEEYLDSNEGLESCGGFSFQESGSLFFSEFKGDYYNVLGLPVRKTFSLLRDCLEDEF